jgi:hypothetical protein
MTMTITRMDTTTTVMMMMMMMMMMTGMTILSASILILQLLLVVDPYQHYGSFYVREEDELFTSVTITVTKMQDLEIKKRTLHTFRDDRATTEQCLESWIDLDRQCKGITGVFTGSLSKVHVRTDSSCT